MVTTHFLPTGLDYGGGDHYKMDKVMPSEAVVNEIALLARRKMDRSRDIIIDQRLQLNAAVCRRYLT